MYGTISRNSSRRSRNNLTNILVVITLLFTSTCCASCGRNARPEAPDDLVYENKALGFSLRFPADWKDRYLAKEFESSVSFFNKGVHDAYPGQGRLFTIGRMIGELVTEEDMQQAPVPQKIVARGNGYTYFVRFPSDVQCPPGDKGLSRDYLGMYEQVSEV